MDLGTFPLLGTFFYRFNRKTKHHTYSYAVRSYHLVLLNMIVVNAYTLRSESTILTYKAFREKLIAGMIEKAVDIPKATKGRPKGSKTTNK